LFKNVDEVIAAYGEALKTVELSGPTSLEPLMHRAIELSQGEYTFLLILTDGDLSDVQRDRDALVNASNFPVSVSAIGFGDGPFNELEDFDDMKGRKFDNFSFEEWTDDVEDAGVLAFQEMIDQYQDLQTIGVLKQKE